MGYDATGNYIRTHNFSADGSAGIKILASRMDAEFNDFASAMPLAVLRDGRNAATGNLPMGGFRHVNVGAPSSATNYIRAKDVIENVPIYVVDAEASADRISVSAAFYTTASAATAPRDGSNLIVKMGSDKSSAVAIRLNTGDGSPHSAGVVLANGSAIYSGALRSGGIYEFIWSSSDTAWQLRNPQVDYANETFPGVIMIATTAEAAAGTNATKAVTPQLMAAKFSATYATTASAGLLEIATTAEIAGSVSASTVNLAVTHGTLHAYASAANVTSAGILEIATTSEVTAGTDTSRAITPAGLKATRPYLAALRAFSASVEFYSRNDLASAWVVSAVGSATDTGRFRITHNIGLTSVHSFHVFIQVGPSSLSGGDPYVTAYDVSASVFYVQVWEPISGNQTSASTTLFIQGVRV